MIAKPSCPLCASERLIKKGCVHNGKQNHKCNDCGRQFVEDPQNKVISQETKGLIDKLLLEKLPLAGIARVAGVSEPRLQGYVNQKYGAVPKRVESTPNKGERLSVQGDEVWSFAGSKKCKKWVRLALDTATREIIGVFIGSRGKSGAKGLWRSLPGVYRQRAVIYTDLWKACTEVLPSKRHKAVGKSSGKTNHIERFNCTLRQRTGPEGAALSKTAGVTARPQYAVVL